MALPHSVYLGRVDPTVAPALLEAFDRGRLELERLRGRTLLRFSERAVEHFVRLEFDIDDTDGVAVGRRTDDSSYPLQIGDQSVALRIPRSMSIVDDPQNLQRGRPVSVSRPSRCARVSEPDASPAMSPPNASAPYRPQPDQRA